MSPFLNLSDVEEIKKESQSNYISPAKITEEVRLRILGAGVTGFEGWTDDNKPVRWQTKPEKLPANIKVQDGYQPIKRFLAALVYSYESDSFKVLQVTQKTLMEQLFKYYQDIDYGDPVNYDIKISKTGVKKDTTYTLIASPPKALPSGILQRYEDFYCNLNNLFDGTDPFTQPTA
jgi:hypothetical protein